MVEGGSIENASLCSLLFVCVVQCTEFKDRVFFIVYAHVNVNHASSLQIIWNLVKKSNLCSIALPYF